MSNKNSHNTSGLTVNVDDTPAVYTGTLPLTIATDGAVLTYTGTDTGAVTYSNWINYPTAHTKAHVGIEYQLVDNGDVYLVNTYGVFHKQSNEEIYNNMKDKCSDTTVKMISMYEFLNMIVNKGMVNY